jgi:hypothetical protein
MVTICSYCKKEFKKKESRKSENNFCSFNCYSLYRAIKNNAKCEVCEKEFYRSPAHIKRAKHVYCSLKCFSLGERGEGNHRYQKDNTNRNCRECGKVKSVDKKVKFCSKECRNEYWKKNGHPKSKERMMFNCGYCGKTVARLGNRRYKNVYCSRDCADRGHSVLMTGKGNSNFINGEAYFPYPAGWNRNYKESIRNLYDKRCQLCGVTEGEKRLHVHHIDWNKTNLDLYNLIPLCHLCHRKCHTTKERSSKELLKKLSLLASQKKMSSI